MRRKTPINEYKQEAFALFQRMLDAIREDVTKTLAHAQFMMPSTELPQMPDFMTMSHIDPLTGEDDARGLGQGGMITTRIPPLQMAQPTAADIGEDPIELGRRGFAKRALSVWFRNKYKHCHGRL